MPTPSQSERTLRMKQEYVRLHESGLSAKTIAHMFDLETATVYRHLQEIADAAGVTRASLLEIPRSKHVTHERQFEPVKPVDTTEFHQHAQNVLDELASLHDAINKQIKTCESIASQIEKEEASWQTLVS